MSHDPKTFGEFSIEATYSDGLRALLHGLGWSAALFVLVPIGALLKVALDVGDGTFESSTLVWAVIFLLIDGALVWGAMRPARQRARYDVLIADEHICVRQPGTEVRLAWSNVTATKLAAGILTVQAGAVAVGLPWYRMSETQRAAVSGPLARHRPNGLKKESQLARLALLWGLLVLMFIAIYNMVAK